MEISVATQCYEWDKPPVFVPDSFGNMSILAKLGKFRTEWSYHSDYDIYWQQALLVNQLPEVIDEYEHMHWKRYGNLPKTKRDAMSDHYLDTRRYFKYATFEFADHVPRYYNICTFKLRIHDIDIQRIPWSITLRQIVRLIEQTPLIKAYKFLDRIQRYPELIYRADMRSKALLAYDHAIRCSSKGEFIPGPINYFAAILDVKGMKLLEYDLMMRELSRD